MNWLTNLFRTAWARFGTLLCAISDHGGVTPAPDGRFGTCKRCGATVDLWPRQWRRRKPKPDRWY